MAPGPRCLTASRREGREELPPQREGPLAELECRCTARSPPSRRGTSHRIQTPPPEHGREVAQGTKNGRGHPAAPLRLAAGRLREGQQQGSEGAGDGRATHARPEEEAPAGPQLRPACRHRLCRRARTPPAPPARAVSLLPAASRPCSLAAREDGRRRHAPTPRGAAPLLPSHTECSPAPQSRARQRRGPALASAVAAPTPPPLPRHGGRSAHRSLERGPRARGLPATARPALRRREARAVVLVGGGPGASAVGRQELRAAADCANVITGSKRV
ncbi:translation initiation factor IF-2-like [Panicum virgatum]|uniref:translation initiation factor IF-2-like n=1 Tax=Panicum virgatum TaxID=38727 RepID=UPI0019D5DA99|nr:translation initiation factor IF-2-like [Panicum virgatum]